MYINILNNDILIILIRKKRGKLLVKDDLIEIILKT